MSVTLEGSLIRLEGDCPVEDAEALVGLICAQPGRAVDVSHCRYLHSAVAQALIALRPALVGASLDEALEAWVFGPLKASTPGAPRPGSVR